MTQMTKAQARHAILAFFTTLANNNPVVSDWNPAQRCQTRDRFQVLDNDYTRIVCGGRALTLQVDTRKNEEGPVTVGRAESCDWSIDDLLGYAQSLSEDEVARLDTPCERLKPVALIAKLIDTEQATINGKAYTCRWDEGDDLYDRFRTFTNDRIDSYSADELLTLSI